MNVSKNRIKIFNRILNKHKVSLNFVKVNFKKIIKLLHYATQHHFVIRRGLVIKNKKVVIKYNTLRTKLLFARNNSKKRKGLPWTKKVLNYLKKRRTIENGGDDIESRGDNFDESMSPDEVQKKIKEQLELLKNGRKAIPLLGNNNTTINSSKEHDNVNTCASPTPPKDVNIDLNEAKEKEENISLNCFESTSWNESNVIVVANISDLGLTCNSNENSVAVEANGIDEEEINCGRSELLEKPNSSEVGSKSKNGMNFLDLLINKMKKATNSTTTASSVEKVSRIDGILPQNDSSSPTNYFQEELTVLAPGIQLIELKNIMATANKDVDLNELRDSCGIEETKENSNSTGLKQIEIVTSEPSEIPESTSKTNNGSKGIITGNPNGEETSSSSSEFLGFTEYELAPCTVPGMLPTPIVWKSKRDITQSAFISEDLEKFLRENSLEHISEVELPKQKSFEDGLVCDGAPPPKMVMPVIPKDLVKSRTVAEKRNVLQRKQSIKYYMIENENTIYRELKKRTKFGTANLSLIRYIQNIDLPSTRDCWKASSWLSTENGRFYFQTLNVDGCEVKLIGGRGNHPIKCKPQQSSKPIETELMKECPQGCRQNVDFRNIKINMYSDDETDNARFTTAPDLKLQIGSVAEDKHACKPAPLSRKCLSSPFEPNLGELEVYEMPDVKLEVFPAVNKPLDERVRPYLKLILPSDCITREWAEFAVSTLVSKLQPEEKELPKSFTFTIPYLNNQKNVLVRKVYNRKEKLEKFSTHDFNFRKTLDPEDDLSVECADVLSEMINSVAIGLSEDSLIKNDPDIDYLNNNKINAEISQRDSGEEKVFEKKNTARKRTPRDKLVTELKKLNATVIDAECLFTPDDKQCRNVHCKFGCVCQSLSGQPILRKHCKKSSCMLECTCKHLVSSDLDNFVNSSLTTEDALLIRQKATAKLAKVEKDFCATVVLTDKETFLINEQNNDRKRSKRAPKRFDDYDTVEKKINLDDSLSSIPKLYPYDDEPPPKKFRHCTVDLQKLEDLDDLEPWCMIHCLYKCFCKGQTTTGVPFEIKKDETFEKEEEEIIYMKKRLYSFEKPDNIEVNVIEDASKTFDLVTEPASKRKNTSVHSSHPSSVDLRKQYATYEKEIDLKRKYYHAGNNLCKRACVVPSKVYRDINRRRAHRMHRKIRASEDAKSRFILIDRINNSLRFKPPNVIENHESRSLLKINNPQLESLENSAHKNQFDSNDENSSTIASFGENTNTNQAKIPVISSVCSLNNNSSSVSAPISGSPNRNSNQFIPESNSSSNISSDMSVNASIANNFVDELPNNSKHMSKYLHSLAIKKLNTAVTKTMHSICAIQKKNTKHIPPPVPNTLSSHQWKLFLQAYVEGLVYIWEIRIAEGSFIAATVTNTMPIVPNALSVINIKAIPRSKLPLLGKMLNAKVINDKTKTLSVLMTGQKNFWRIIGFINSSYDYLTKGGIFKPTPQSHPWLSKKINALFKLLILRQFKEGNDTKTSEDIDLNNMKTPSAVTTANTTTVQDVGIPVLQIPPSNVEIRKVTHSEIEGIVIPMAVLGDHRWLVLDLVEDFSHIYIPAWKNFLSYDRIKKAVMLSQGTKKIVRIGQENSAVDVFATPVHTQRIYMGPFHIDKNQDIVLYQNIDSRMMLREDFEISQNICRINKTTGFWLYKKKGKLIFDMDLKSLQMSDVMRIQTDMSSPQDEDCIIVDVERNLDNNENLQEDISNISCNKSTLNNEINLEATSSEENTSVSNDNSQTLTNANRSLTSTTIGNPQFSGNRLSLIKSGPYVSQHNFIAKKVAVIPNKTNILKKQINKKISSGNLQFGESPSTSVLPTSTNVSTMKVAKISTANSSNNIVIIKNPDCNLMKINNKANMKLQDKEISLKTCEPANFAIDNLQNNDSIYKISDSSGSEKSQLLTEVKCSTAQTVENQSLQPIISSVQTIKRESENSPLILKRTSSIQKQIRYEVKNATVTNLCSNASAAKLLPSSNSTSGKVATLSTKNAMLYNSLIKKKQMEPSNKLKISTSLPQLTCTSQYATLTNFSSNTLPMISPTSRSSQIVLKDHKETKVPTGKKLPTLLKPTATISCPQMMQTTTAVKKIYLTTISPSCQPVSTTVFSTPSTSTGSSAGRLLITNVSSGSLMHTGESSLPKNTISPNNTSDTGSSGNKLLITNVSSGSVDTSQSTLSKNTISSIDTNETGSSRTKLLIKNVSSGSIMHTSESTLSNNAVPPKSTSDNKSSGAKFLITNVSSGSIMHTSESTLSNNAVPSKNNSDNKSSGAKFLITNVSSGNVVYTSESTAATSAISSNNTSNSIENSVGNVDGSQMIHAPEFGYMVSDEPTIGKFPVKKLGEVYLLKMPLLKGILRIMGMEMVNKYLAQYMRKHADRFPGATDNIKWRFVAHKTLKVKNNKTSPVDVPKIVPPKPEQNKTADPVLLKIGKIQKNLLSPHTQEPSQSKKTNEIDASESKLLKLKDFTIKKAVTQTSTTTSKDEQNPAPLSPVTIVRGVIPKQSSTASSSDPVAKKIKLVTAKKTLVPSAKILKKVTLKSNPPPAAPPQLMQAKPASEVILIDDDD